MRQGEGEKDRQSETLRDKDRGSGRRNDVIESKRYRVRQVRAACLCV